MTRAEKRAAAKVKRQKIWDKLVVAFAKHEGTCASGVVQVREATVSMIKKCPQDKTLIMDALSEFCANMSVIIEAANKGKESRT